jgi:heavy metal sensor kinase
MFRSVRYRITLWYLILLAVVLAVFCVGVYFVLRSSLYSNLDDTIENRVATFQGLLEFEESRPTLPANAAASGVDADERLVRVFDSSGEVTFDGSEEAGGAPVNQNAIERALAGDATTYSSKIGDENLRVQATPIVEDETIVGVLEVGVTKDDVEETLDLLLLIMLVAYPLTLGIAAIEGLLLAGRVLSPIDDVTNMARRISAEDLSQRLDLDLPDDELGRLARTFDEMIARLDEAFQRQRQFTADASHELRTPLTVIKGQVEVALNQPRDAEGYREVLRSVNEEVDRLSRMVGGLLTLARADAGQAVHTKEAVSMTVVVDGAVEQVRPLAERKDLRLGVEHGTEEAMQADEDLLLQLVLNLLDNAIKFTAAGGRIAVRVRREASDAVLEIRDTGAGIAPDALPHLFERFFRGDPARSAGAEGAGLGLSLVKWIADRHGATVSVDSRPNEGSTFVVRMRRA